MFELLKSISVLTFAALALAAPPVPYAAKFQRQQERPGQHVWEPGEQVQASFVSECEGFLALRVASEDPEQGDVFKIEGASSHEIQNMLDWRWSTVEGVVEIIAPVEEPSDFTNAQTYRARIVSLALALPSNKKNPSAAEVRAMRPGEQVILEGMVIGLDYGFVSILTRHFTYHVRLLDGVPLIEADLSGQLKSLKSSDRIRLGDQVLMATHIGEDGELAVPWCRSCQLTLPGPLWRGGK